MTKCSNNNYVFVYAPANSTLGPVSYTHLMSAIAERTESEVHYRDNRLTDTTGQISVSDATAHAACLTAKDVNASAIVTVSESRCV